MSLTFRIETGPLGEQERGENSRTPCLDKTYSGLSGNVTRLNIDYFLAFAMHDLKANYNENDNVFLITFEIAI